MEASLLLPINEINRKIESDVDDNDAIAQWEGNEDLVREVFTYFDVIFLVRIKAVCQKWKRLSEATINQKAAQKKTFETNGELRDAVRWYASYKVAYAEDLATTYGWPIGKWDVSKIQDFSCVFHGVHSFNEDIGSWDVSNAISMDGMFWHATTFNHDISSWDTSNVKTMSSMFNCARAFDQDISSWHTSKVTSMEFMFYSALSSWDTPNVTTMLGMFDEATAFNQDVSSWNISNVTNMEGMFAGAKAFNKTFRVETRKWKSSTGGGYLSFKLTRRDNVFGQRLLTFLRNFIQ